MTSVEWVRVVDTLVLIFSVGCVVWFGVYCISKFWKGW